MLRISLAHPRTTETTEFSSWHPYRQGTIAAGRHELFRLRRYGPGRQTWRFHRKIMRTWRISWENHGKVEKSWENHGAICFFSYKWKFIAGKIVELKGTCPASHVWWHWRVFLSCDIRDMVKLQVTLFFELVLWMFMVIPWPMGMPKLFE